MQATMAIAQTDGHQFEGPPGRQPGASLDIFDIGAGKQSSGWLVERQAGVISVLLGQSDVPGMDGPVVLQLRAAPNAGDELGAAVVEHAEVLTEGLCLIRMRCRGRMSPTDRNTDAS